MARPYGITPRDDAFDRAYRGENASAILTALLAEWPTLERSLARHLARRAIRHARRYGV